DPGSRKTLRDILEIKGYTTEVFATGKPAVEWAKQDKVAIALIDLKLEDMSGLEVLQQLKEVSPDVECILLTGYASKASAIDAINLGAYSYVQKPYDMEQLLLSIRRAMEKREAREEFKRLKELNENIVQSANEGIVVQNADGYITFANPATCELLGYQQSELVGKHWTVMVPRDQQNLVEAADRRREKGESDQYELELVRKDEERVHVLVSGAPRVDEGAFRGSLAVFTDISARVWAEREIRQRKDELELINTLNEAVNRGDSLQEIIHLLTRGTKRLLSGSSSTVYLLSEDREHLVMRNLSVHPRIAKRIEKLIGFSIPQIRLPTESPGPYHQILQNGKPGLFNQPEEIRELAAAFIATLRSGGVVKPIKKLIPQIIKLLGIQSVICLPLISSGDPIGLLEVSSGEPFGESNLKRLEAIAGQLTAAIERKRSDIKLRESEERFRAIFENAPIGMAIGEAGNSTMKVNCAFEDMLGFSEAERQNLTVEHLTHPEDLEKDLNLYEKILEGEQDHYRLEKRYIRKDKSVMWGDLTLGVVRNGQGGIQYSFAMVADITERKHAERALHRKLEETTVLHALATVGAEATNVDDLIQWAVDLIGETLYTDNLGIYLLDEETSEMRVHPSYRAGVRTGRYKRIPLGSGIIGQVGLDGLPRRIADVSQEPSYLRADPRIRSELCVPLRMGERIFGVINVESTRLDAFSEEDERLLTTLAGQLATTIEKMRLFGAAQRQARQLSALYDTALATGGVLDTERLLERLSQQVKELLEPDSLLVTLHHPQEAEIEVLMALEMGEKLNDWVGQRLSLDDAGLTGWTIREQRPLLVRDMMRDALPVQPKHATRPARSWLGVPLMVRDQVVGSMAVQSFQPEEFDEGQRRFLESLAAPVAISLANARLFEETQRHAKEFMQLYETAKDLSGEQDLTKLLETIVERATKLLDVPFGGVYLYDAALDEMELIVAQGFPVPLGTRLKLGEGMAGRVAKTRKPMMVEDYRTWEGRSQQYGDVPFTSVLEVPMLYGGELVGVLVINETAPSIRKFTEADVQLLSLLGAQAAGAVHSARLFEETHQRAKELEAVATVSAAMRKAPNRAQMTPIIVEQMMDLLGTQHAGLAMRDSETGGILVEQGYGAWADLAGQRQVAGEGVSGQVIATGQPFI
ncbi:MAG: GAF domain-containing protein, partial [Anaerolineales bacterium]